MDYSKVIAVGMMLSGCIGSGVGSTASESLAAANDDSGNETLLSVSLSSFNLSNISQGSICSSTAPNRSAYGSITIDLGSDFKAEHILSGKTVFGVSGIIAIGR